jgi:hypothetical protein
MQLDIHLQRGHQHLIDPCRVESCQAQVLYVDRAAPLARGSSGLHATPPTIKGFIFSRLQSNA